MAEQHRSGPETRRPLWIIAGSLLTIAICLMLLVIRNLLTDSRKDVSSDLGISERQATNVQNHDSARTLPIAVRQSPRPTRGTEAGQSTTAEVGLTVLESSTARQETEVITAPVGIPPAFGALSSSKFTAAIAGRVTLRGTPPREKPVDMSASPPCARLETNTLTTRDFVVSADGGLGNVFVSIVKDGDFARSRTNHELAFVNCQIRPYMSGAMIGQRLAFRNADSQEHTIEIAKTNRAPFTSMHLSPKEDRSMSDLVQRPEFLLRVTCHEHDWELAYVSFVNHPFFTVTDTNGHFVIPNVPPGRYTLFALHPKAQGTNNSIRITVQPEKISQADLVLDAPSH